MKKTILFISFLFAFALTTISQTFSTKLDTVFGKDCLVFTFKNDTKQAFHSISVKAVYVHEKHGRTMRNYKFRVNLFPDEIIKGNPFVNEHRLMMLEGGYRLDTNSIKVTFSDK